MARQQRARFRAGSLFLRAFTGVVESGEVSVSGCNPSRTRRSVRCYLTYKKQYDDTEDAGAILATFSTGPTIRSYGWNLVTEIVGTFVLIFVIIMFGHTPSGLGPLAVALLVVSIGASLGGPTGYAINPARDLGPRIAHAVLPIRHKGSNNWAYAWVPVAGPVIGSVLAALVAYIY
ncbi:aquaporin [Kushneria aurantia]|uniref:MIP/aquaporin family protein n=1 Tax=Kushneria aurantia TaxID=504092 RepID=A0ABV6G135_9GAMM